MSDSPELSAIRTCINVWKCVWKSWNIFYFFAPWNMSIYTGQLRVLYSVSHIFFMGIYTCVQPAVMYVESVHFSCNSCWPGCVRIYFRYRPNDVSALIFGFLIYRCQFDFVVSKACKWKCYSINIFQSFRWPDFWELDFLVRCANEYGISGDMNSFCKI